MMGEPDLCALKGRKSDQKRALGSGRNGISVLEVSEDICRTSGKSAQPAKLSKGWDAADAINEGWEKSDILDLIAHFDGKSGQNPPLNKPENPSFDGMELWHTPDKTTFATLCIDGHAEHWDLGSSHFRNYLSFQHFQSEGKALSQTALEDRRRTLAGEALFCWQRTPGLYPHWRARWRDIPRPWQRRLPEMLC